MAPDRGDILELLKDKLDFIEKGDGQSVRTPWQSKFTFRNSLTCINYGDPERTHRVVHVTCSILSAREVSEWLRAKIKQIEEERTEHATV